MEIHDYDPSNLPTTKQREAICQFLNTHLEQYGDPLSQIETAISYALGEAGRPGGFLLTHQETTGEITGAVVVNKTGMRGYIPENILVYIATHHDHRGKGIGKALMKKAIERADGDVALHVEPQNPAKGLYEHLGFKNKYLEMRYKKEDK